MLKKRTALRVYNTFGGAYKSTHTISFGIIMTSVAATVTTTIITAAEASDVVQAVGWDISLGVANTKVGRFFLSKLF